MFSLVRRSEILKGVKIYPFSIIKNSIIGAYSYISYSCKINNAIIGKYCSIAQNVKMGLGSHPTNFISSNPIFYSPNNPLKENWIKKVSNYKEYSKVIIGNDVWIGTNVTILDGVKIGDGAIIGAHSLVTKNVAAYSIVGGVPAREIRKRFDKEIIEKLMELKWWDTPPKKLQQIDVLKLFSSEVDMNLIERLERELIES